MAPFGCLFTHKLHFQGIPGYSCVEGEPEDGYSQKHPSVSMIDLIDSRSGRHLRRQRRNTLPPSGLARENNDHPSNADPPGARETSEMLTGKKAGRIHITRKGRKTQTLGQERRGMRRNRPYQLRWRKFHAWKRHIAYRRPYRRPGISKIPTCFPTIAGASGVTFQERKERENR